MKHTLALVLMVFGSFGVVGHDAEKEQTLICSCDLQIMSGDNLLNKCSGNPQPKYGLIIDWQESYLSFQDRKYFFKDNPNTISGTKLEFRKSPEVDTKYNVEFEKVTHELTLTEVNFVEKYRFTQYFSCKESN
jgi:hypothetical protein